MRQISSVVKLTVPTIGNCASAQTTASASSTQRVATRLTMKPTTIAEMENRKKNEEPSRPNCSGSSFSSVMIGTPARPTTILSAKFTSMNKNSRNVIFQAPLGVGCVAILSPVSLTHRKPCWSGVSPMLAMAFRATQPAFVRDPHCPVRSHCRPRQPPDGVANAGRNPITIVSASR